jgi:hypothetical protein
MAYTSLGIRPILVCPADPIACTPLSIRLTPGFLADPTAYIPLSIHHILGYLAVPIMGKYARYLTSRAGCLFTVVNNLKTIIGRQKTITTPHPYEKEPIWHTTD